MLSFKQEASGEPPPWMEDRRKNCSKEKVHLCNAFCFSHQVPLVIAFLNAHCQIFKSHNDACTFLLLNQTIWLLGSCQIMIKLFWGSILYALSAVPSVLWLRLPVSDIEVASVIDGRGSRRLAVGLWLRGNWSLPTRGVGNTPLHYVQFVKYIFPRNRTTSN